MSSTEPAAPPESAGPLVRALSTALAATPEPAPGEAAAPADAEQLMRDALARRHVEVEEVVPGHLLFRFAGYIIGGMQGTQTTLVSEHARRIAGDRKLLERFLRHGDVAVPEPETAAGSPEKPAAEQTGGESADDGDDTDDAGGGTPAPEGGRTSLALEVLVVGSEAVAALLRTPRFEHTAQGLTFTAAGQQRLSVDVTDQLCAGLRELCVDAVAALPGLAMAAVQVRTPALDSAEEAAVTGLEVDPDLSTYHHPDVGPGQDAAAAVAEKILRRASR